MKKDTSHQSFCITTHDDDADVTVSIDKDPVALLVAIGGGLSHFLIDLDDDEGVDAMFYLLRVGVQAGIDKQKADR